MNAKFRLFYFLTLIISSSIVAQDLIKIKNGSFEDITASETDNMIVHNVANNWKSGNYFRGESPVTIHTPDQVMFGVVNEAYDGDVFVSMVTRMNETWEGISQEFSEASKKDQKYTMTMTLAKSVKMFSAMSNVINIDENEFSNGNAKSVVVNVWMDREYCDQRPNKHGQLIWTSPPIDHNEWKDYTFQFIPNNNHKWIFIEVYFADAEEEGAQAYFGHALIDYISDIEEVK